MIKRKKIDFNKVDEAFPKIEDIFAQYGVKIVVAYLFGSYRRKMVTSLSDIDIAVLLDDAISEKDQFSLRGQIYSDLSKLLKTDEIDLLLLNNAPLNMQYGVLRDKKVLYCSDRKKMVDFESRVIKMYLDIKPLRDEFNREFFKRAGDYIG